MFTSSFGTGMRENPERYPTTVSCKIGIAKVTSWKAVPLTGNASETKPKEEEDGQKKEKYFFLILYGERKSCLEDC